MNNITFSVSTQEKGATKYITYGRSIGKSKLTCK